MGLFSRKKNNNDQSLGSFTQTIAYHSLSAGPPPEIGALPYKPSGQSKLTDDTKKQKTASGSSRDKQSTAFNSNAVPPFIVQLNGHHRDRSRGRSETPKPTNGDLTVLQPAKRFAKSTDSLSSVSPMRSERYFNILHSAISPGLSKEGKLSMYNEEIADRNSVYSEGPTRRSFMEEASSPDLTDRNLSEASSNGTSKQRGGSNLNKTHSFAHIYDARQESAKSIDGIVGQRPPPYSVAKSPQQIHSLASTATVSLRTELAKKQPSLREVSEREIELDLMPKGTGNRSAPRYDTKAKDTRTKEDKSLKKKSMPGIEKGSFLVPEVNVDSGQERILRLSAISMEDGLDEDVFSEQLHIPAERAESIKSAKSTKSLKRKSFTSFSRSKGKSQVSLDESPIDPERSQSHTNLSRLVQVDFSPDQNVNQASSSSLFIQGEKPSILPSLSQNQNDSAREILSDLPPRATRESPPRGVKTPAKKRMKSKRSPIRRKGVSLRGVHSTHVFSSSEYSSSGPQSDVGDDPSTEEIAAKADTVQKIRRTMAPANGYSRPWSEYDLEVPVQRQLDPSRSNRSRAKSELIQGQELAADIRAMKRRSMTVTQPDVSDTENAGQTRATPPLNSGGLSAPGFIDSIDDTAQFPLPPSNSSRKSSMKKCQKDKRAKQPQSVIRDFATDPPTVPKSLRPLRASQSVPSDPDERPSNAATHLHVTLSRNANPPPVRTTTVNHTAPLPPANTIGWGKLSTNDAISTSPKNHINSPSAGFRFQTPSRSTQSFHSTASASTNTLKGSPQIKSKTHLQKSRSLSASPSSSTFPPSSPPPPPFHLQISSYPSSPHNSKSKPSRQSKRSQHPHRMSLPSSPFSPPSPSSSSSSSLLRKDSPAYRRLEALKAELNLASIPRRIYVEDGVEVDRDAKGLIGHRGDDDDEVPPVPSIPVSLAVVRGKSLNQAQAQAQAQAHSRPASECPSDYNYLDEKDGGNEEWERKGPEQEKGHHHVGFGDSEALPMTDGVREHGHRRTKSMGSGSASGSGSVQRNPSPVGKKEEVRKVVVKVPRRKSSLSKRNRELGIAIEDLEWE